MEGAIQVVLVIAAFFGLLAALSRYQKGRRRAAIEAVAQEAGWTFEPGPMYPADLHIGRFPAFNRGRNQRASNVVRTTHGVAEVALFDYQYTTGSREETKVTRETIAHIRSPRLRLPQFALVPKGLVHTLGELFGHGHITFEESPDFSSRYVVQSTEVPYIVRDLFTSSLRGYFEQHEGWTVEGEADELLVYRQGRLAMREELRPRVDEAVAMASIFER